MRITFETSDETDTIGLAERLGKNLKRGDIVCLYGDLGAGKTTFIKGIARSVDIPEREITSASFVIIAEHYGRYPLYHIDLYRLSDADEAMNTGMDEYLYGDGISVVEWAERLGDYPDCTVEIHIKDIGDKKRKISIKGNAEYIKGLE
ncbi:MAG TPA: tRNA (adenosine(37)-N6)-threonylcarbamoyltransferase complex ATPase subunit type 1 TsaE [Nitrospirae bacterium]|nr:tRNA threonylcarbamoyladenosine biosynthesis protein TsaE [bacterium BMS3Abin08]HDO35118.1 tRNA (adenosine(37)-N6)-threonylcarbamoyltransferase complex ATPase subunit type 1 TsaE [Nitrospirota bacterium]HDY71662.1 tRNA (adenosine(37)-N6)-threonylcarbamoyltransferase complex ATPase subunit type 1 TsaE [Nitrospirota bacterium]